MTNMLTTKEVASKLHMGINQTRDLINRKDFPKVKIGQRKWLIPEDTLDEWIHKNLGKDLS
jgi:excisionase family DNA binding protein